MILHRVSESQIGQSKNERCNQGPRSYEEMGDGGRRSLVSVDCGDSNAGSR